MANRTFNDAQALEKEIKTLFAKISIGATGAPTLVKPGSLGIASVARSAQGDYLVTLEDKYPALMGFEGVLLVSSAEDITFQLKAEDVDGAKTFSFFTKAAATATDPSNGSVIYLTIHLKNTSVQY